MNILYEDELKQIFPIFYYCHYKSIIKRICNINYENKVRVVFAQEKFKTVNLFECDWCLVLLLALFQEFGGGIEPASSA